MHRMSSISGWYEPLSLDGSFLLGAGGDSWYSSLSDSTDVALSKSVLRRPRPSVGPVWRALTGARCSLARLCASCQCFFALIHSASNLPKRRLGTVTSQAMHRGIRSQSGYIPSDTTNLPPLCPTDDPLHDFLASECLDEIYGSLITGGHRDDKADHVNPRRGRGANIGERLQLLYGVS